MFDAIAVPANRDAVDALPRGYGVVAGNPAPARLCEMRAGHTDDVLVVAIASAAWRPSGIALSAYARSQCVPRLSSVPSERRSSS